MKRNLMIAVLVLLVAQAEGASALRRLLRMPTNELPPVVTTTTIPPAPTTTTVPPASGVEVDEIDLSTVIWHEADIRQWPITAALKAYVKGDNLRLETALLKNVQGNGDTSGNPWVIALCPDGKLHAATWEWISYSRQDRPLWKLLDANHINVGAFDGVNKSPGTVVYVAVAGWSRDNKRSEKIRTAFKRVVLP